MVFLNELTGGFTDEPLDNNTRSFQINELNDLNLSYEYLKLLEVIETGALNGEILDKTEHFEEFFPSIKDFLYRAIDYSKRYNKNLDMEYLDYGIQVPDKLNKEKDAIDAILPYFNSFDSRSGKDWRNVMPITLIPAILGAMGATVINPNLVTSKYGKRANELEARLVKSLAKILGYKELDKVGGLAVEGGTKGNMYGYLLGLRKAFPESREQGLMNLKQKFKFINSGSGHFSNFTNLASIGVGSDCAYRIPSNSENSVDVAKLKEQLFSCYENDEIVPTVLITVGTTDACALDNIAQVHEVIEELMITYPDKFRPHLHVDAAIGWALSFYNNYDTETNPLHFNETMITKLAAVQNVCRNFHLADSVTIDVHKTGYTPYNSSFIIVKDQADFKNFEWEDSSFRYFNPSDFEISPVKYSLECTRGAAGVFGTAMALKTLGIEGYQTLLGAGLQYSEILKQRLTSLGNIAILNKNLGFTCLFRPYPSFVKNAEVLIEKEKHDPEFQEASIQLNIYVSGLYKYWKNHKQPESPLVDYISAASWSQYDNGSYELPSWKAYMLNPRAGKYIKTFLKELISLRKEYEAFVPAEQLENLKKILC
jgi:glutamate/tyrosine decarboxylase-like PLP-dependent enzyme